MMRTSLYDEHVRLNAKMTEFADWEMPLYYSGIIREVEAVRSAVGIFDLSHMGILAVSGPQALELLQFVTTNDVSKLNIGQAQYTLMCNDEGGVLDDLIIYRTADEAYLLVVNAANTINDFDWIQTHNRWNADCEDRSQAMDIIAVQGPVANDLLSSVITSAADIPRRFQIREGRVGDIRCLIAGTGYTGEDGFEFYCSASDSLTLWSALTEAGDALGIQPAGLGARDLLRLEAGYPLYGHELTPCTSPVDARLIWVVSFTKGEFLGRESICRQRQAEPSRLLVGLEALDRCVPRQGFEIIADHEHIGEVTSGGFSPTLGKGIAMAYIHPSHTQEGNQVDVQVRGRPCVCRIVSLPFYRSGQTGATERKAVRGATSAT